MSTTTTTPAPPGGGLRLPADWWSVLFNMVLVVGLGVLIGSQYMEPDKRVLAVSAAMIMLGVAWRLDTVNGLGVLILMLPFPRGTVFGSTNLALTLLLLVIWLLRFTTGTASRPRATPLDGPLLAVVMTWIVSFYNVEPRFLPLALGNTLLFASCLGIYYLVVNNVKTAHHLQRLHAFMLVSATTVFLVSLFELFLPGRALVPGWIEFQGSTITEGTNVHAQRIGGTFFDYELLSDFCALQFIFLIFLFARARSIGRRTALSALMGITLVVLVATATRGAMVALAIGLIYLLILTRRHLRLIPMVVFGTVGAIVLSAAVFSIIRVTHVADVFARFSETTLVNGMPDSRAMAWKGAFERFLVHPIIGWGPYYSTQLELVRQFWPHNLYLYIANCFGVIGLAAFLWMLWRLWRRTTPGTDSLHDAGYARAYLLAARVQLVVFLIDQVKIEYLRNWIYQFQIWVMFSSMIAASMVVERESAAARRSEPD